MIKPQRLYEGDTVAIVSVQRLAGEPDIAGAQRLVSDTSKTFNLEVKVMPNALKGIDYLYNHPEKRAEDLNDALKDPEVKAIICAIGGKESIRMLPYVDFEALKNYPKILRAIPTQLQITSCSTITVSLRVTALPSSRTLPKT